MDRTLKIAERLKYMRKSFGLNQHQLGVELGYVDSVISDWECARRQPNLDALVKMARFFNQPISYFLGVESESIPTEYIEIHDLFYGMKPEFQETIMELMKNLQEKKNG